MLLRSLPTFFFICTVCISAITGHIYSGNFIENVPLSDKWNITEELKESTSNTSSDVYIKNGRLILGKSSTFHPPKITSNSINYSSLEIELDANSGLMVVLLTTSIKYIFVDASYVYLESPFETDNRLKNTNQRVTFERREDGWYVENSDQKIHEDTNSIIYMMTGSTQDSRLKKITYRDDNKKVLFQEDYQSQGFVSLGALYGGLAGMVLAGIGLFGIIRGHFFVPLFNVIFLVSYPFHQLSFGRKCKSILYFSNV